jgi:hypothetical protein
MGGFNWRSAESAPTDRSPRGLDRRFDRRRATPRRRANPRRRATLAAALPLAAKPANNPFRADGNYQPLNPSADSVTAIAALNR